MVAGVDIQSIKIVSDRGTQRQVPVDICTVEGFRRQSKSALGLSQLKREK